MTQWLVLLCNEVERAEGRCGGKLYMGGETPHPFCVGHTTLEIEDTSGVGCQIGSYVSGAGVWGKGLGLDTPQMWESLV